MYLRIVEFIYEEQIRLVDCLLDKWAKDIIHEHIRNVERGDGVQVRVASFKGV